MIDQNNLTEEEIEQIKQKADYLAKIRQSRGSVSEDDWNKAIEAIDKETEAIDRKQHPKKYKILQIWNWIGFKEKKLWDFVQLLLLPILLLGGGNAFQESTKQKEMAAAADKDKQERLTKYLDDMSTLLEKKLLSSKIDSSNKVIKDPILAAAQAKTIVALTSLDSTRQNSVLQFLKSSTLNGLDGGKGILFRAEMYKATLSGANLEQAKMIQAYLQNGNLKKADLTGADLRSIDLENANLTKASLFGSDLRRAQLMYTNLVEANLATADLTKSDLTGSDMAGATLDRAILLGVDLYNVKNLTKEQIGLGIEISDKHPLLCHTKLPKNVREEMKLKQSEYSSDRDCDKLKKILIKRYNGRYETMYQKEKFNKQVGKVSAEQDMKDADNFNQRISQATINNPECIILIPGDRPSKDCNEIFKLSPLNSTSD